MRRAPRRPVSDSPAGGLRRAAWLLAALAASGCGHEPKAEVKSVTAPPTVRIVHPTIQKIVRVVGQPSFIESYERTAVYPKLTGYIEKWNVDIGDKVKKNDVLATLFVPELREDFGTKKADVKLAQEQVNLALKWVEVAKADVQAAEARLEEARAILAKYQAEVDRWDSEVVRLKREVEKDVVAPQILLESENQWKASGAARDAAKATIAKAEAELLSRRATLAKAEVDVSVARARLAVAESEEKRLEAWVGYLVLPAPYDGIVVERNANTFDFVLPSTGDPTANSRAPHVSATGAAPIYVVERTDIVRIFVDIPEQDANYVKVGTKATVLARAYRDEPIPGTVTRTSWALNIKSRTLRAEIDLPNPGSQLLPGMYAYAKVIIERPNARALPVNAITYSGERSFCWTHKDGRAERLEVQTGVRNGDWIEVTNRRIPTAETGVTGDPWVPFDGSEQVILGDLSILSDGALVQVDSKSAEGKVASATPAPGHPPTDARPGAPPRR